MTDYENPKRDIYRAYISGLLNIGDAVGAGTQVDFRGYTVGTLYIPSGTVSSITYYTSPAEDGDYYPVYNNSGVIVSTTIESSDNVAVSLPNELLGIGYLEVVGNEELTNVRYSFKG